MTVLVITLASLLSSMPVPQPPDSLVMKMPKSEEGCILSLPRKGPGLALPVLEIGSTMIHHRPFRVLKKLDE